MIKVIIFDIGGVIVSRMEKMLLIDIAKQHKINFEKLSVIVKKHWKLFGTGKISEDEYWKRIIKDSKIKENAKDLSKRVYSYHYEIEGTLDIARSLRSRYKLAIISDNSVEWGTFTIKKLNLKSLFDFIVLSCDVDLLKPDKKIFKYTLKKLKIKPEECIFIDDKERNVKSAGELELKAILFRSAEQLKKDLLNLGIKV